MRSIRAILSLSLSMVIILVGLSTAMMYYYHALEEKKSHIDQFIHTESTILPGEIAQPLWKYDLDGVSFLCSERLKDNRIKSIKITDDEQNVVFNTDDGSTENSLSVVRPVTYNGEDIGTIVITFDNSELAELGKDIFKVTCYILFFVVCTAIISVLLLTKWLVTKPFNQITKILTELKNENYNRRFRGSSLKEIQPILNGLKGLSQELFERNKEIKEQTHNLEEHNKTLLGEIDRRKEAESALIESKSFLNTLLEHIPMPVFYKDSDGYYLGFNQAYEDFFGKNRNELIGKTVFEISPEALAKTYQTKDQELLKNGGMQEYESQILNGKGNVRDVTLHKAVYRDRQGDISGLIGTILDITERKKSESEREKLQAELMQSQKMEAVGTLAGGIAHDFNNILAVILGNAELAIDDVPKGNLVAECLEEIRLASGRAKEMIQQLLSFSRKTDEKNKPLNMVPVIKASMKMLRTAIPSSVEFSQHISDEPCNIMGNASQINQIVMNLVTNAAHAMPEEGLIELLLKKVGLLEEKLCFDCILPPGDYVCLKVRDTGTGMAPETMTRIFEPYYTTKDVGKGTGMGLSVVHGIMKGHLGGILVESELRKGTVFEIYFPALVEMIEEEKEPEGEIKGGSERILFVDDEESMVNLNQQRLERLGYEVKSTTKPQDALEWFKADPDQFDVIITDMTMPRMTGDRLTAEVLKIRPQMRVIICTGYSERMSAEKAKGLGVCKYLEKPIDLRNLASALREVLDDGPISAVPMQDGEAKS